MCRGLVTPPPLAEFDGQWGTSFLLSARKATHITYLQYAPNVKNPPEKERERGPAEDVGKYRCWVSVILEWRIFSDVAYPWNTGEVPEATETPDSTAMTCESIDGRGKIAIMHRHTESKRNDG